MPSAVGRGRVAVLAQLRDHLPVDRLAHALAERRDAVRVLGRVEGQAVRQRRRQVGVVVVLGILRHVRRLDVRHEVVRPVGLATDDLQQARVVGRGEDPLHAVDPRGARSPVVGVLREGVRLSAEAGDAVERARPDRVGVRKAGDVLHLRPDVAGDDRDVRELRAEERRVDLLELDRDLVLAGELDRGDVAGRPDEVDPVGGLVLPADREAVEHVRRRQRLAVGPLHVRLHGDRERLAVLRPAEALGEHVVLAPASDRRRDEEVLVDATPREVTLGAEVERVEVAHERLVARACCDDARMISGARARRRGDSRRTHDRHDERRGHHHRQGSCPD